MTATEPTTAFRPIPEFDGVHQIWPRGDRLEAIRAATKRYRERFLSQGQVQAIKTFDIVTAPYYARFAYQGFSTNVNPFISIMNRMLVIQFEGFDGRLKTMVWEPTVPEGSVKAPIYSKLLQIGEKLRVSRLVGGALVKYWSEPDDVLPSIGLSNADVDYIAFDHLHVQDPRMIMGSGKALPGESAPRKPLFPNAKMPVHRLELDTFAAMHPLQSFFYVDNGMDGVDEDRCEIIDGDVELGVGVSLLWTPGHTDGNLSLCVNTPDGVWVSSENGMAIDNWQPELSKIPGVKQLARFFNQEVVLNNDTVEDILEQYDSMVKEKTMASYSPRDPRWLQVMPSSQSLTLKRQWPVNPTYSHEPLQYGTIVNPNRSG